MRSFFILVLIGLLFLSSLAFVVFRLKDPDFLVAQSRKANVYNHVVNSSERIMGDDGEKYGLSKDDMVEVVRAAVDGERFYSFMHQYVSAFSDYLTGKSQNIQFSYDLAPVKQKAVDEMTAKVLAKYAQLPICTPTELRNWGFDEGMPSCQLSPGSAQARSIEQDVRTNVGKSFEELPDTVNVAQSADKLVEVKKKVDLAMKIIWGIWLATTVILLLYLLIYRSSGLVSLAVAFLIVGLMQVGFSLVAWDWIGQNIADRIGGSEEAKSFAPLAIDLATAVLEVLKTALGNISILFLSGGALLLVWGIVSRFHRKKAQTLSVPKT